MSWSVVSAIWRREMRTYFASPSAYIVLGVFLLITGWFFTLNLFKENLAHMRSIFDVLPFLLVIFAPAISMRLISEERKSGTLELLVTMPVRDFDVILGKFLAALSLYAAALLLTFFYPFTIMTLGDAQVGSIVAGYIALFLLGGAYLAVGLLGSAITENQIVAFILSFALCAVLAILVFAALVIPQPVADVIQYLSSTYHFQNIARGVVDSRDVIYFLSLIFLSLLMASRAMSQRKFL
jgi:gliding motility-associated transport system permease protein